MDRTPLNKDRARDHQPTTLLLQFAPRQHELRHTEFCRHDAAPESATTACELPISIKLVPSHTGVWW